MNNYVRQMGAMSVVVRGEEMHPECMTEDESKITIVFKKQAPDKYCVRCGKPLKEVPADEA